MFKKKKKQEQTFRVHELDFSDLKLVSHKKEIIILYDRDGYRFKIFYDKDKAFTYLKNQFKQWWKWEEDMFKKTKKGIKDLGFEIGFGVTFKTIEMECSTYGKN